MQKRTIIGLNIIGGSTVWAREFRKNWARLIQKIYEVDPLTCPKCFSKMRVISVIEDEEIIKKILKHLGLWGREARPPPKAITPSIDVHVDYSARPGATTEKERPSVVKRKNEALKVDSASQVWARDSQVPPCDDYLYFDPEYPMSYGMGQNRGPQ